MKHKRSKLDYNLSVEEENRNTRDEVEYVRSPVPKVMAVILFVLGVIATISSIAYMMVLYHMLKKQKLSKFQLEDGSQVVVVSKRLVIKCLKLCLDKFCNIFLECFSVP